AAAAPGRTPSRRPRPTAPPRTPPRPDAVAISVASVVLHPTARGRAPGGLPVGRSLPDGPAPRRPAPAENRKTDGVVYHLASPACERRGCRANPGVHTPGSPESLKSCPTPTTCPTTR